VKLLKEVTLSTLGVCTFGVAYLSNFQITQNTKSVESTTIASLANPATIDNQGLITNIPKSNIGKVSYLSKDFGKNLPNSTLPLLGKVENSPTVTYSFGGEVANAWWQRLAFNGGLYLIEWIDSRGVKYQFPNSTKISWNEASDICNRSNGKLIWKNNLKTCIDR
jgi:hypothetical protein